MGPRRMQPRGIQQISHGASRLECGHPLLHGAVDLIWGCARRVCAGASAGARADGRCGARLHGAARREAARGTHVGRCVVSLRLQVVIEPFGSLDSRSEDVFAAGALQNGAQGQCFANRRSVTMLCRLAHSDDALLTVARGPSRQKFARIGACFARGIKFLHSS
eukprot:366157-Chlamydomonas_euryale.AAC.19